MAPNGLLCADVPLRTYTLTAPPLPLDVVKGVPNQGLGQVFLSAFLSCVLLSIWCLVSLCLLVKPYSLTPPDPYLFWHLFTTEVAQNKARR